MFLEPVLAKTRRKKKRKLRTFSSHLASMFFKFLTPPSRADCRAQIVVFFFSSFQASWAQLHHVLTANYLFFISQPPPLGLQCLWTGRQELLLGLTLAPSASMCSEWWM